MRLSLSVLLAALLLTLPSARAFAQADGTAAPLHDAIANAFADVGNRPIDQSPAPRPVAVEYTDAYRMRAKIHKAASFATIPLFGTELVLGQSLYNGYPNGRDSAKKGAHIAVGTGIIGLYGVQAVTGFMNLMEARKDPHQRKLRLAHSILMLASGGGFAITPLTAPGGGFRTAPSAPQLHRALAIGSIGVGTAGYLLMLFGGR